MREEYDRQVKIERDGMQVTLEFPKESDRDASISREVRKILLSLFREQLTARMEN